MKYINHKLIGLAVATALFTACVDEYECNLQVEKPEEVAGSEYLATFDVLKSYISRDANSPFKLTANLNPSDFTAHEVAYSTIMNNFDGIDVGSTTYMPATAVDDQGAYNFGGMSTLADALAGTDVTAYGGTLASYQGQRAAYYAEQFEPTIIPYEPEKGRTVLFNFEADEIGTAYPMSGNSSAEVTTDPDDPNKKVLCVGRADEFASYSFAKLNVKLPEGRKLGDYVSLEFDMRVVDSHGIYGAGMKVYINGQEFNVGMNAATIGCNPNQWNRGAVIKMKDATAPGFVLPASLAELTEFELQVGTASGEAYYYLDNIYMNYEVAGTGTTVIDFEGDELGKTYPMTGNSSSVVENDPAGESGKVLHVGTESDPSSHSYPTFTLQLQPGRTLGDYTAIALDMYIINSQGIWGDGVRVIINGVEMNSGKGPGNFGCPDNAWGRGTVYIPFGTENGNGSVMIPEELKGLTEITLAIGAGSGAWHGYIDNITLYWKMDDTIIEKTPEEKADILTADMNAWIGGMMDAGGEAVTMWNIIGEPLSQTQDANTFNFGEYLGGDVEFARTAVAMARDTAAVPVQLFVSQTFEQTDDMASKADQLTTLVNSYEEDGETVIDGYNILLHTVYSKDATIQASNESKITALFTRLKEAGKPVRISDLSVCVENTDGTLIQAGQVSTDDRINAGKYLSFIMQEYRRIIDAANQYGISLSGMNESSSANKLCPWTSGWNRNLFYEGVVNGLK